MEKWLIIFKFLLYFQTFSRNEYMVDLNALQGDFNDRTSELDFTRNRNVCFQCSNCSFIRIHNLLQKENRRTSL
jgi:hypothetical protein